jgi:hypothetical protein
MELEMELMMRFTAKTLNGENDKEMKRGEKWI